MNRHKRAKQEIVCRCNNISRETIEKAITDDGCKTMNEIFDCTTAGVGPCGGTCRRRIVPMLEEYLATGKFPEKLIPDIRDRTTNNSSSSDAAGSASNSGAGGSSSSGGSSGEGGN